MRLPRFVSMLLIALFPLGAFAQDGKREDLHALVQKLEKAIADVRGLPFKTPVAAKIVGRPAEVSKGVQGYYSTKEKTLFVYEDIAGNYERGVLIHEMVHALQDQHFGLAKLHQTTFGSDAELALAALIEGDATFTMIELLKKEQPAVAKMLESPLEKSKNPRNAFLYGQGARYVQALKERGGWNAVNAAYKNPPRTTAAVLSLGSPTATINLGPGATRGAFGIVEALTGHPESAASALTLARAWRGDRAIVDQESQAWIIAFATPKDAQLFQEAYGKVRKDENGAVHANLVSGERVHLLKAKNETQLRALRDRLHAPKLTVWSYPDKRFLSFGQFIDRLSEFDGICVGESHDNDLHHHVQLRIIKGLHANDERLAVGMEMFQRPYQTALDRYARGELTEEAFLEASEYRQRWGFSWNLYRPIVEFGRANHIPIAALNVPRELTQRLSKVGHEGMTKEEKAQLGDIDFHVKAHRDHWFERLAKLHGKAEIPVDQKERSYQVMAAWDGYMASSAAAFQKERKVRRMVILAGSGHIDRGFGIPARTAKLTGGKVATVRIEVGATAAHAIAEPVSDFIVFIEAQSLTFHGGKFAPPAK